MIWNSSLNFLEIFIEKNQLRGSNSNPNQSSIELFETKTLMFDPPAESDHEFSSSKYLSTLSKTNQKE